jgi:hypothetical protein
MSGFLTPYKSVFDAIKTAIETKASIKTVVLGKRYTHGKLPRAVINARETPVAPLEMGPTLEVKVNISVDLIVLEYTPENWFTDIIPLMSSIVDAVLADRTLGGKAQDCILTGFNPGEVEIQEGLNPKTKVPEKKFFGGTITFEAVVWYAP